MALKVTDFPRGEFAGYFELIDGDGGEVTARVYPLPSGAPVAFDGKRDKAEAFIRAEMAKLRKGVQ